MPIFYAPSNETYVSLAVSDGDTVDATTTCTTLVPSGPNIAATVLLPFAPIDGQLVTINCVANSINPMTLVVASGDTLAANITGMTKGDYVKFIYNDEGSVWYRIG